MASSPRIALSAFALLTALAAPARAADPDSPFERCDGKFGLCRYVDKAGQEIIPARFERAMQFSEGLAAVRLDGRFGFIDRSGAVVIEPRFDLAGDFYHGLAEILVGNNTGVIDRSGRVLVPPQFKRAIPLTKDVIIASEGTWQSFFHADSQSLENLRGNIPQLEGGLYSISAARWIRRPGERFRGLAKFEIDGRGLVWAKVRGDPRDLYGLLNSDGTWVIEPQYEHAGRLLDERAIVRKRVDGVQLNGAVDPDGKHVVPLRPWGLAYWKNGQAIAFGSGAAGGKQALVDKDGNIIGGRWFDKVIERAEEGDVAVVEIEGRAVGLDRAGNIVANPRNGRVHASCPSGIRIVEIDGKSQITDASGQPTTPHLFDRIASKPRCDAPFSVKLSGKWGYVGLDGKLLFDPPSFDNQFDFVGGQAWVQQDGRWGIIDTAGRFTVVPKFDSPGQRRGGLYQVRLNGRDFWIDASGDEHPEPPVIRPRDARDCGNGVRLIERDGRWGIADGDKVLIAPRFRSVSCFQRGVAWVPVDAKRQWCALDSNGRDRDRPACIDTFYPWRLSHGRPEKFSDDPFESSVLWMRAYLEFAAGKRDKPPQWLPDRR
jgi:hypothetical protein